VAGAAAGARLAGAAPPPAGAGAVADGLTEDPDVPEGPEGALQPARAARPAATAPATRALEKRIVVEVLSLNWQQAERGKAQAGVTSTSTQ
jgi:hypothetical protein